MTLLTHEEEEILHRVRRLEQMTHKLIALCEKILIDVTPDTYPKTDSVHVIPDSLEHRYI